MSLKLSYDDDIRMLRDSAGGVFADAEPAKALTSAILGAIRYSAGGWEAATIRCLPTGTVQVLTGSTPRPGG